MTDDLKALTGLANPLQRHGKTDLATSVMVIRCFAYGLSVKLTAQKTGLTQKSVRAHFLELRTRLGNPQFAKWHGANTKFLRAPSDNVEDAIRAGYFDQMARCYFNTVCYRNYADGKRRKRLCRKCPLRDRFQSDETLIEALAFIDAIRAFYKHIGIGSETGEKAAIFKARAIHYSNASHSQPNYPNA